MLHEPFSRMDTLKGDTGTKWMGLRTDAGKASSLPLQNPRNYSDRRTGSKVNASRAVETKGWQWDTCSARVHQASRALECPLPDRGRAEGGRGWGRRGPYMPGDTLNLQSPEHFKATVIL